MYVSSPSFRASWSFTVRSINHMPSRRLFPSFSCIPEEAPPLPCSAKIRSDPSAVSEWESASLQIKTCRMTTAYYGHAPWHRRRVLVLSKVLG